MTNTELLRAKVDQSGYKIRFIAEKVGITYQGLLNKINNRSEFRASEIQALYDLLKLTEKERVSIFFDQDVGKTPTCDHQECNDEGKALAMANEEAGEGF